MQTNVFAQAREFIATPNDAAHARFRHELLKRIHGNGFYVVQRNGGWYLMDRLDNRKKWRV